MCPRRHPKQGLHLPGTTNRAARIACKVWAAAGTIPRNAHSGRGTADMASAPLGTVLGHLHALAAAPRAAELSDEQLLRRFAARRDEAAFAALVRRHGRLVWNVCRHTLGHEQDAEDAFQATFLALAHGADSVRRAGALASWLHGVAFRVAMKAKRSAARRHAREQQSPPRPAGGAVPESAWRQLQAALDEEVQG